MDGLRTALCVGIAVIAGTLLLASYRDKDADDIVHWFVIAVCIIAAFF
ncbi:MAG: hypothetical protein ACLTVB_00655 [Sutterella sp.]